MIKKYLAITSSLVFIVTTGIICPLNTKAIEDIEPVEVVSMRSEYEKHYDNGDGTYPAYIDTVPLHYYENGEWLDIDNTLIQDESGNYINKSNSMKVTLSPETSISSINTIVKKSNDSNQMVSIDYNGYSLSWSLIDTTISDKKTVIKDKPIVMSKNVMDIEAENLKTANTQTDIADEKIYPVISISVSEQEYVEKKIGSNKLNAKISESVNKLNSSVAYNSIYESVDCKVDIQPNSVKETIIIENPDNLIEEYSYFIKSDGLVAELCEDNSVIFSNDGNSIFTIPAPFMFDSSENAENNYNVSVSVEEYNDGYLYTIIPNNEWLLDESRVYPVMIDPEVTTSDYNNISSYYNSEANPYSVFRDIYLKIGNETSNGYQSYVFLPNSFSNYGDYAIIKDAKFNLYFLPNDMEEDKAISIYSNQTKPNIDFWWKKASELSQYNTYISSFDISKSTSNYTRYSADITSLVQSWLNYSKTSSIGIPNYGFKLVSESGTGSTVTAYSERSKYYKPYYEITYSISSEYTLDYAPHKYNNIYTQNSVNINNFQNRMNCYAYALQVYYRNSGNYNLLPGELGLSNSNLTSYYTTLRNYYADSPSNYNFNLSSDRRKFVEERMKEDAKALNFSISLPFDAKNGKFVLPSNFNPSSERIIAMTTAMHFGDCEYHFYVRNGNGTCLNGHGGNCSMWSHKPSLGEITNKAFSDNNIILCDENIAEYVDDNNNRVNYEEANYYIINKNVNLYDSWHGNKTNNGSTPYRP